MHCIFAGARGLFLDRLVRDTSAEVVVPEPGHLRLLGRAEPVVMAQSRVQQFVTLFQVWKENCATGRANVSLARVYSRVATRVPVFLFPGETESPEQQRTGGEASLQVLCGGKR